MTDQEYTQEAERHLAALMERQRQRRVASDNMEAAFRGADMDAGAVSGDEGDSTYEGAKQAARVYAQARNSNARVRRYAQDNESQRDGVASALQWLDRKRKSVFKK